QDLRLRAADVGEDRIPTDQRHHFGDLPEQRPHGRRQDDDVRLRDQLQLGPRFREDFHVEGPLHGLRAPGDADDAGEPAVRERGGERSPDLPQPDDCDGRRIHCYLEDISRPTALAIGLSSWMRASNMSGVRLWGPSQSAFSGWGWTSMSTPSAPTATAALASGATRWRSPVACDGSITTGRCDRLFRTGT